MERASVQRSVRSGSQDCLQRQEGSLWGQGLGRVSSPGVTRKDIVLTVGRSLGKKMGVRWQESAAGGGRVFNARSLTCITKGCGVLWSWRCGYLQCLLKSKPALGVRLQGREARDREGGSGG